MKYVVTLMAAFGAVAFAYYLNLKSPDLRYQLSSPIPMDTELSGGTRAVQQIEIANVGKAIAQKVQVKFRKPIGKLSVIKDSQGDTYDTYPGIGAAGSREVIYNALRPAGRIQIVLSGGEPLTEQDLEVRHLEGLATLALTSQAGIASQLASYAFIVIVAFYIWLSARALAKENLASRSRWDPAAILRQGKPLLVSNSAWKSILDEAAARIPNEKMRETGDVSSWEVFRLLNSPKPEHITDATWNKVLRTLTHGFISRLKAAASDAHVYRNLVNLRKLLAVPKPSGVFDENWTQLTESISAMYVGALLALDEMRSHASSLLKRFADRKPEGLLERDWEDYQTWLRSLYFARLFQDLRTVANPSEQLAHADLTPLTEFESRTLKKLAYEREMIEIPNVRTLEGADEFLRAGKPAFMSERDYQHLTKTAKTIKAAAEAERQYSTLLPQVRDLLAGSGLAAERPDGIPQDAWADLKRIEGQIVTIKDENERRQAGLTRQQAETSTLKARVIKQLDVINTFINDPGVLDRIEEYENLFAPGNLANLRRLAALNGRG